MGGLLAAQLKAELEPAVVCDRPRCQCALSAAGRGAEAVAQRRLAVAGQRDAAVYRRWQLCAGDAGIREGASRRWGVARFVFAELFDMGHRDGFWILFRASRQ